MGHEASGVIDAVGNAVTHIALGDHVAIEPGFPCRRCKQCNRGRYNLCGSMRFAADPPLTDGTLSRLFRIPDDFVHKIPASVSLQEAVLVEPLSVAVHGVRLSELRTGQNALIQGSGTIGLLTAAVAKAFGATKVFITDINQKKLDFARGFVDCIPYSPNPELDPSEQSLDFRAKLLEEDNEDVDVVLECTGVESSAQLGLHVIGPGGIFVQVGMGRPEQRLPILAMCEKEAVLKTAFRYGPEDYEIALGLLKSGKVSVKKLISSVVPFEEAPRAWEMTMNGDGIKNLIQGIAD